MHILHFQGLDALAGPNAAGTLYYPLSPYVSSIAPLSTQSLYPPPRRAALF